MRVQYGILSTQNNVFSFHQNGVLVNQPVPNFANALQALDALGSNGWELCDRNNILPPLNSPDEFIFLRRL
jgi:hypothetical protein